MALTEVKQAKNNNIEYIEPMELDDKIQVYSEAHFMRIRTGDEKKLSLKIGRYKKSKIFGKYTKMGTPETINPKSELTLTNIELENLVEYINKHYYPLQNNETKYLALDDETMATLVKEKPENVSKLVKVALTNDIDLSDINKLIEISDRKKAINEFCENYNNDVEEKVWQKWFQENNWVFGSDFVRVSEDRRIDIKNIADFIVENIDGFVDVIEIKRPSDSMNFFDNSTDHDNIVPSHHLTKAITQLANYLSTLEKKSNELDTTKRIGKILKPRGILIFGNSKNWNEKQWEAFRLLNSSLVNISIYTYNMVYNRAVKMNEYLSGEKKEK